MLTHCHCGCIYEEVDCPNCNPTDRVKQLELEVKGWAQNARAAREFQVEAELALHAEAAAAYERVENHINSCSEGPWAKFGFQMAKEVRALATPEQTAALSTVKAEARLGGLQEALAAIAGLPTPTSEEVMVGHEEAYRVIEAIMKREIPK